MINKKLLQFKIINIIYSIVYSKKESVQMDVDNFYNHMKVQIFIWYNAIKFKHILGNKNKKDYQL